jgi:hypothetical protein
VIGPRIARSSSSSPSGACAAYSARCSLENTFRTGFSPSTAALTIAPRARECPRMTGVYELDKRARSFAGVFVKPSDGLEPSTFSLPWNFSGNWWQPVATVFAWFCGFRTCRFAGDCDRLQPRRSIKARFFVVGFGYEAVALPSLRAPLQFGVLPSARSSRTTRPPSL